MEKRTYVFHETRSIEVPATSREEAAALWADKGVDAATEVVSLQAAIVAVLPAREVSGDVLG